MTETKTKKISTTSQVDHSLLIKPVFSAKSTDLAKSKQYAFIFKIRATKPQIKRLIEKVYGVKVEKVNVARYEGKMKVFGRNFGRKSDFKKAFVQLTKDSKEIAVLPQSEKVEKKKSEKV